MSATRATWVGLGAIGLWSLLALLTAASGDIPPLELAALTFAIGGGVGLVYAAARGRLRALAAPWPVWLVGVGGLFGYHALYFAALRAAPPAQASLVAYLWPLFIVLMSALLPGERLAARHIVGAVLSFAGAALLIGARGVDSGTHPQAALGLALAFAGALVWSSYSVASRILKAAPTETVAGFCLVTSALAAAAHFALEPTVWPRRPGEVAAIVVLGLGPVGLAFYLWDHGVKRGDIRLLGVAAYAAPLLSTLFLTIAGYAAATWTLAAACAAIVAGAFVAAR